MLMFGVGLSPEPLTCTTLYTFRETLVLELDGLLSWHVWLNGRDPSRS